MWFKANRKEAIHHTDRASWKRLSHTRCIVKIYHKFGKWINLQDKSLLTSISRHKLRGSDNRSKRNLPKETGRKDRMQNSDKRKGIPQRRSSNVLKRCRRLARAYHWWQRRKAGKGLVNCLECAHGWWDHTKPDSIGAAQRRPGAKQGYL